MNEASLHITAIIFWICFGIMLYGYAVYPLLLWILQNLKYNFLKSPSPVDKTLPSVTILIAAYNESACIVDKIHNSYAIDYPQHLLHIWVVADGSTDETVELVKRFPGVQIFYEVERKGKLAALQRVMGAISTDCIVFSDANAMLNRECLRALAVVWQDQMVGAIAGEKRVANAQNSTSGESAYWRYESLIKKWEGRLYSVTGGAGELFAIRTNLFRPIDEQMISDDLLISWSIIAQGYKIAYVADAFSEETADTDFRSTIDRRVRVSSGSVQAMMHLFKEGYQWSPIFWWELISHRLLRTLIIPYCLIFLFPLNYLLLSQSEIYLYFFFIQLFCWFAAIGYWFFSDAFQSYLWIKIPAFYIWVHIAMILGAWRLIRGKQSVLWKTYSRHKRPGS
ncbi:MAG: glycosyltransferase family 2 protein [Chitinophagia bacterium]|jgi:cellulose synthase/poly-beta-1,6-N-acetylglucosamine synthase-like glycosyltransferase